MMSCSYSWELVKFFFYLMLKKSEGDHLFIGGWHTLLCGGLRYVKDGVIFSCQGREEGAQKTYKDLYGIKLGTNGQKEKGKWKETFSTPCLRRKQSASMSVTSFPSQFNFEIS